MSQSTFWSVPRSVLSVYMAWCHTSPWPVIDGVLEGTIWGLLKWRERTEHSLRIMQNHCTSQYSVRS